MPNPQERPMTTATIGRLAGYSAQQVRDLERLGVIPIADRGGNGYRRYGEHHLVALHAYRALAVAIGPVPARQLMPALLRGSIDEAVEKIDNLHASIARGRTQIHEARRALDAIVADAGDVFESRDAMTISELAQALDIRTSALRHWEAEGLVHPDRVTVSRARQYSAPAVAEARIVAALRAGGYRLPPIARILDRLRTHGMTEEAQAVLDDRLTDLTRRSIALLEAAGHLHALLTDMRDGRLPPLE